MNIVKRTYEEFYNLLLGVLLPKNEFLKAKAPIDVQEYIFNVTGITLEREHSYGSMEIPNKGTFILIYTDAVEKITSNIYKESFSLALKPIYYILVNTNERLTKESDYLIDVLIVINRSFCNVLDTDGLSSSTQYITTKFFVNTVIIFKILNIVFDMNDYSHIKELCNIYDETGINSGFKYDDYLSMLIPYDVYTLLDLAKIYRIFNLCVVEKADDALADKYVDIESGRKAGVMTASHHLKKNTSGDKSE